MKTDRKRGVTCTLLKILVGLGTQKEECFFSLSELTFVLHIFAIAIILESARVHTQCCKINVAMT